MSSDRGYRVELGILARALGVLDGDGCECALCGASPFSSAGSKASVLGPNFADHDLIGEAADICAGCAACMAGKPGSDPPPLRMTHVLSTEDGTCASLDRPAFWAALESPPPVSHVLSWATGKKRHHWLYAGLSTPERQAIGSDFGAIPHSPREDRELRAAVLNLLRGEAKGDKMTPILSRSSVETGEYHPRAVARFGLTDWQRLESLVARRRPSALLSLLCWCAPVVEAGSPVEVDDVMDPRDRIAVDLIADLSEASGLRSSDGKGYWGGILRHRLERVRRMPLHDAVSRLMDWLQVSPITPAGKEALGRLKMLTPEQEAEVSEAIQKRPALVVAWAFETIQRRKENR